MTQVPKKVLFLLPSLTGGGAERVFSILLRHLDRDVFEPHLGLLGAEGEYLEEIPKDVTIHQLNISRARYSLPGIVRLVWKIRPHTVLSTLGHMNLMLGMAKPFFPRTTQLIVREAVVASAYQRQETR